MATMTFAIILLFLLTLTAASASMYEVIPRGAVQNDGRVLDDSEASPQLISFDGDLDAILVLALAKAAEGGDYNQDGGEDGTFSCPDASTEHLEILTWTYKIETVADANVATVFGEVSEITLEMIAPLSLLCKNEDVAYADIAAMDANIASSESTEGESKSVSGVICCLLSC